MHDCMMKSKYDLERGKYCCKETEIVCTPVSGNPGKVSHDL